MMAFPSMLTIHAEDAGIQVPTFEGEDDEYDKNQYPHFHVFCTVQLGRAMDWDEPWHNAPIIAAIPDDKIRTITIDELRELGIRGI